jgi:type II restriction/modification system DNA methylase subunit YeeA
MTANGFQPRRDPVLQPLDTIRLQDAILDCSEPEQPKEPSWPAVDYIIGNPPYLGGKLLRATLGDAYVDNLFTVYAGRVPREGDLICYFLEKARAAIEAGQAQRAGLLATNSIRGGANRRVLERIKASGDIFVAWSDEPWVLNGAAVRISIIGFDDGSEAHRMLNGQPVATINPDLTSTIDVTVAKPLPENRGIAFMGDTKGGPFDVPGELARRWLALPRNPNGRPNSDVVRPWVNGLDITRRPRDMWIIDFGVDMPVGQAAQYEAPFENVRQHVKPQRAENNRAAYRERWWLHVEARSGMRKALGPLRRFVCTPTVARHRLFIWSDGTALPDHQLIVFARDSDYSFGVLHSRPHEVWALRAGTWLGAGNDPRYTPTTTFETFPFPWPLNSEPIDDPRMEAIARAARELVEQRDRWLNPEGAGAAELKRRTLTNLYNARPAWLDLAHRRLDRAVLDAYGWSHDLSDDEILARLLALNLERAAPIHHDKTPGIAGAK